MQVSDTELENEYRRRFFLKAGDQINSGESAAKHLTAMLTEDPSRESFAVMYLSGSNKLITSEILFQGTLTTSAVYPREVVVNALKHNAAAIVIGHNHPSGNLQPSRDDINITNKIKAACLTVDIALHDHIIVSSEGFYSFADNGIL